MSSESLTTLKSSALGCEHFSADIYFVTSISAVIWIVLEESKTDFLSFLLFLMLRSLSLFSTMHWNPPGEFFSAAQLHLSNRLARMKASLLHPPGIISTVLQKINTTNQTNPNILKKLSTLEWMKWASVEEDNHLLLKVKMACTWPLLLLWALSRFSWPAGSRGGSVIFVSYKLAQRPSASPPARSRHPGLPWGTQDYNTAVACSEGSSDVLCPSLHCHYPCDTTLWSWSQQSADHNHLATRTVTMPPSGDV